VTKDELFFLLFKWANSSAPMKPPAPMIATDLGVAATSAVCMVVPVRRRRRRSKVRECVILCACVSMEEFREGVDKNNLINSVPYFD
jgi:hypothetical protein